MKNHLSGFLISLLLHAWLFGLFYSVFADQTSAPAEQEAIALKLSMFVPPAPEPPPETVTVAEPPPPPPPEPVVEKEPPPEPPPKLVEKPKPKKKPKPKPKPVVKPVDPEPIVETKPVTEPPPVAIAPTQPVAPVVVPQAPKHTKLMNDYKLALRQAIEANKHYPRQARRMRQQGTAVVAFTVMQDGSIQNLRITQSAGNRSLDKAALKAIEKINGKFPIPDELQKSSWDFDVPMQYSLL